ncbi:peptidase S8 [Aquimarina sp. BL5]|uniref:S8 family serine peptidase n=1 Tax=Aquimarina sp. BL5 TaxID=1714860 RepID=UPI000E4DEC4C|nr:S8 family serine peptidase [Aquimarina sp. BL5]AXT51312.1 peptidase S8 [Aquimarina sp. BL5]RKM93367.1 peptidase S8 [Aquimarina sp. BL5]
MNETLFSKELRILFFYFVILTPFKFNAQVQSTKNDSSENKKTDPWYFKDVTKDSVFGISLTEANQVLTQKKLKGREIVIAVIDTEIDINHEDLKDQIWHNHKEIPDNSMDDDDNGYIDDIDGWNFLGNTNGENIIHSNFEITRIVRKYQEKFEGLNIDQIKVPDTSNFKLYKKAKKAYDDQLKEAKFNYDYVKNIDLKYKTARKELTAYFPDNDFSKEHLDSIKIDTTDSNLKKHYLAVKQMIDYKVTQNQIDQTLSIYKNYLDFYLNLEYDERILLSEDNKKNSNYGNPNVSGNTDKLYHGTLVSGVLAANRNNQLGIKGIYDKIRIMPLCISSNGDEYDQDIALAIRYAVDNGAKVINMSSSKDVSMYKKMVYNALQYAYENDVLFVRSVGNDNLDLDQEQNRCYPEKNKNYDYNKIFISVGGSTEGINKSLKASFSSYGKNSVDIFAPSVNIKTTSINNEYTMDEGNSMAAPIVSGIAALLWGYYPNLSAVEIKDIIMKSGRDYKNSVEIEQQDGTKIQIPFSELSKSGKVVNAYNALLLADKLSKSKN